MKKTNEKVNPDFDELKRLCNGDDKFYLEMLETFNNSLKKGFVDIELCYKNNDWIGIMEYAHRMCSPVRHLKAEQLYQILKNIENNAGKNINGEVLLAMINKAKVIADNLMNIIKIEMEEVNSDNS